MTLSLAWLKKSTDSEELIFVTDSRLRAGYAWDCGPKILSLPRSDALIAFAGDTEWTYPLMIQMFNAIKYYKKSRERAMDIHDLKGHTLRVFNQMKNQFKDLPKGEKEKHADNTFFILGGYSWKKKGFYIWKLKYQFGDNGFTYVPIKRWHGLKGYKDLKYSSSCKLTIIGTPDKVVDFQKRLENLLESRYGKFIDQFVYEPFEVLRDMLREAKDSDPIGGPPQFVKVYEHMNYMPYCVLWPDAKGKKTLLGRELLGYEDTQLPVFDPDALSIIEAFGKSIIKNIDEQN